MAELDEREDEDPYDYQPPPGPSPRRGPAGGGPRRGTSSALLDLIRRDALELHLGRRAAPEPRDACRAGAKADPAGFSREALRRDGRASTRSCAEAEPVRRRVAVVGRGADALHAGDRRPLARRHRAAPAPPGGAQRGMAEVLARPGRHGQDVGAGPGQEGGQRRGRRGGAERAPRERTSDAPEAGRKRRHAPDGKVGTTNGKAAGTTNGKVAGTTNGKVVGTTNGVAAGPGGRRRHG